MIVPIDKLEPGIMVARDVVNTNGGVLVTAGTNLTAQLIRILKMWGIESVAIGEAGKEESASALESLIDIVFVQAAEVQVNKRFKHVPVTHRAVTPIRELALKRLAQQLSQEANPSSNRKA